MIQQNLCPNCNKPVLDTEEICPNCGAIIGARPAQKPLNKRAIKSKPQNMMAASPQKRRTRTGGPVSSRAQTEVSQGRPQRKRAPQGRPGSGQRKPRRPRQGGQYMHSAPDSRHDDGLRRPTRGQTLEKKTDLTTIIIIAVTIIAAIVVVIVMSSDTKAEGGLHIEKTDGEVVSTEEVDPIMNLFKDISYKNYEDHFEIILRTEGQISSAQIDEAVKYFQKQLSVKESAILIIGNEAEFTIWQRNGGNVNMIFTRRTPTKFDDYKKVPFAIPYN